MIENAASVHLSQIHLSLFHVENRRLQDFFSSSNRTPKGTGGRRSTEALHVDLIVMLKLTVTIFNAPNAYSYLYKYFYL